MLKVTKAVLQRAGYAVLSASNGPDALKVWEQSRESIRLLLTDLVMHGGMSGHDLAVRILADRPGTKIVFTSGYSAGLAGRDLSLPRGQDFLQKPFSTLHLLATVRRSLDE